MPTYEERSQLIKALSEKQYFDALKVKEPSKNVRIGDRIGNTGRYQVLSADGGVTSNGVKTFNASLPSDGFVRGTKGGNAIALDHRNVKRAEPKQRIEKTLLTSNIIFLLLSSVGNELFVGGDRNEPESIFTPKNIIQFQSHQITKTGIGLGDWIVTGTYLKNISIDGVDTPRNTQFTITSDQTKEEDFAIDYLASGIFSAVSSTSITYTVSKLFKADEEVYLGSLLTKYYFSHYEAIIPSFFKVFVKGSINDTPFQVNQATSISLKLKTGGSDRGNGWLETLPHLPVDDGSLLLSTFPISTRETSPAQILFRNGQNLIFPRDAGDFTQSYRIVFWGKGSFPLPTPLVEGVIYDLVFTFNSTDGLGYRLKLNGSFVGIGGGQTTIEFCEIIATPVLQFNSSFLQIFEENPYYSEADAIDKNSPFSQSIKARLDTTHEILNAVKSVYMLSETDLRNGRVGFVYQYREYILIAQGANREYQLVAKVTVIPSPVGVATGYEIEFRLYKNDGTYKALDTFKSSEFIAHSGESVLYETIFADYSSTALNFANGNNLINPSNYLIQPSPSVDGLPSASVYKFNLSGEKISLEMLEEDFIEFDTDNFNYVAISAYFD